jgi:hypothetical protein
MGYAFPSGLQMTMSSIHRQKHLGLCLPTVGSQTWVRSGWDFFQHKWGIETLAHGDESKPLEISMSSAMKGEPGLSTGLTTLGALHPFIRAWKSGHRNLWGSNRGQGPISFLPLYRKSSTFTHCTTSASNFKSYPPTFPSSNCIQPCYLLCSWLSQL